MKKIIALLTVTAIALSFTACSNVSDSLDSVKNVFDAAEAIADNVKETGDRINETSDKILNQVEKNLEEQKKAEEEINKLADGILEEVEENLKEQEQSSDKFDQLVDNFLSQKNQHFSNDTIDGRWTRDTVTVFPKEAYYQNGTLVLTCFVVNGYSTTASDLHVKSVSVEGDNGHLIANGFFDSQKLTVAPLSYVTYTFYFSGDTLADADADLSHLLVNYRFSCYH